MTEDHNPRPVTAAELKLKTLERFDHDVADARTALRAAEATADPAKIAPAQAAYDAALKAKAESGVTDRDIAEASQDVLDARGETHSEVNILPPDLGIRTVEADADLSDAIARGNPRLIATATKNLEEARQLDEDAKATHVAAAPDRIKAQMEGARS